ncbi:hypothetical protein BJV78DRAFT_182715 [Lactifluus subvellereus]|nr:hypothetical protein BJV78DRAFT_182715 [Lactifluus subvellereus]
MSESSSIPPDIVRVTAPILFGPMINWALYGILCVQTYVYSYNFPDDRRYLKALAYFVFLMETVQTALTGADVYYWFMAGFGDLNRLKKSNFSAIDSPTVDAIISFIVQGFFCYRIWTLNKKAWWLALIIATLSVIQAIGAAWGGIKAVTLETYAVVKTAQYVCTTGFIRVGSLPCCCADFFMVKLWLITSTLADVLIAVAMMWLLRRTRGIEGRYSSYVLPRVVRLTVETNILTASVAVISFILYVAFPNEIYYTCPTGVIGKLYSNTFFVTLNNRIYFRDHSSPVRLGDSAYIERAPRPAVAARLSAQTRLSQPSTMSGTSISLHEILPKVDIEKRDDHRNVVIIPSDPTAEP